MSHIAVFLEEYDEKKDTWGNIEGYHFIVFEEFIKWFKYIKEHVHENSVAHICEVKINGHLKNINIEEYGNMKDLK